MQLSDIDLLDRGTCSRTACRTTGSRTSAPTLRCAGTRSRTAAGFWVVTKYDDVVAVGRDAQTYSSDQSNGGVVGIEDEFSEAAAQGSGDAQAHAHDRSAEHTRYRSS